MDPDHYSTKTHEEILSTNTNIYYYLKLIAAKYKANIIAVYKEKTCLVLVFEKWSEQLVARRRELVDPIRRDMDPLLLSNLWDNWCC